MREKKEWLIVTFSTTTAAMALERYCQKENLPGRIIPLPTKISAGCGLAWRTEPQEKDDLMERMEREHLAWETMHVIVL